MNKFKINIKSIYKNLSFGIFLIIFVLVVGIVPNFYNISFSYSFIIIVVSILVSLVIILFFDYRINSTKNEVEIFDDKILVKSKGVIIEEVSKQRIKKVIIHASPSIRRKSSFFLFPFEMFHFVKILKDDETSIYISSLSDIKLYEKINGMPIFKNNLVLKKNGLTGNGSFINSIFLDKMGDDN